MRLSGKYWPIHPKPLPDELFSSWLIRIIKGNSPEMTLHTFCHLNWPGKQIWTRDIDKCADAELLISIAERTGTSISRAMKTLLSSYVGYVFETLSIYGNSKWIRPIGVYHRTRRRNGLRWCPKCLDEDSRPYFRKQWRASFVSTCVKHGVILRDFCSKCSAPCIPHKSSFTDCHNCGSDRRQ